MAESGAVLTGDGEKAPPLTLDNVMAAVKGVKRWNHLSILFSVLSIIRDQYDSDEAYGKAVLEKFLLGEGNYQPTWRSVIFCLHWEDEVALADKIRNFGEPVQDATLTTDKVAEVLELVNNWSSLQPSRRIPIEQQIIPQDRLSAIEEKYTTKRDIASEYASRYVQYHPLASWTHLASCLYYYGEFAAVEKLKPHLPLRDLTITTEKLVELFGTVNEQWRVDSVGAWLGLPDSKREEVEGNYQSRTQRRDAYLDLYVSDHPYPSWKTVTRALHQADKVERTYVQGFLGISDLGVVLEAVWEARSKWYNLGLKLGTSPGTLDSISTTGRDNPDLCITPMIKDWLNNSNPQPTWAAVAKALKSPMVGYGHLAGQLPR